VSTAPYHLDLPPFVRRTLGLRARRRIPYDAVVTVRWGEAAYLLTTPDDIRHVLVDNAENYSKTRLLTSAQGRLRAGAGLLTASGREHRRQRALLQPLFHRDSIEGFTRTIVDRIQRTTASWRDGAEVDIAKEMARMTLSVMLDSLFGTDAATDHDPLIGAIEARRRHTDYVYHSRLPFRTRLPTRVVRAYRKAIVEIDDRIAEEIRRRRESGGPNDDLLAMLMSATYSDGSTMSDGQIRDEILTLTSAGYETLGEALTWTLYLLTRHEDANDRVTSEIDAVLGGSVPTMYDAAKLEFTSSVLREAMRLYPPTWIFERVADESDELPSGATVRPGAIMYLCQYVMHRHPRYFPAPERFDPDRFMPPTQRPFRFVYFPFGDGAHTCIGENFAMLEGVCALALILRRFRLELLPGQNIVPRAGVTLSPRNGLRVKTIEHRAGKN
jgi:cytochrome P450